MARTYKNSKEEIITEITRICKELKRSPTSREFSKLSKFPLSTVIYRFRTYKIAIEAANGKLIEVKRYSDKEIISHFQKMAKELGHTPLCSEYRENPLVCIQTIVRKFTSYSNLCTAAGFASNKPKRLEVDKDVLLDDLSRIIHELGRIPSVKDYKELGNYPYSSFSKFFGGIKWAVSKLAQQKALPDGIMIGRIKYEA